MNRSCRVVLSLCLGLLSGAAVSVKGAPSPELWGTLAQGSQPVGFRQVFAFDKSRTWLPTRNVEGEFTPDVDGRPVQVNVWYPAASTSAPRMKLGDYIEQTAPAGFDRINAEMLRRNRDSIQGSFDETASAKLLAMPMDAVRDAAPAQGSYPLVILIGGLGADINTNVVMAEFLASHGYVVASVSLLGRSGDQLAPSRSAADIEAGTRDMEYASSLLCASKDVDCRRTAVIGHSIGAVQAVLLGQRNGNVIAVVGLDGTYAFKGNASTLTGAEGFYPDQARYALLDLRRQQGMQSADLDFSAIDQLQYVDRDSVQLKNMHHSDFTSFAVTGEAMHVPIKPVYKGTGWDRATARRGYELAANVVLSFLDMQIKQDAQAKRQFAALTKDAQVASTARRPALPFPPSPVDAIAWAKAGKAAELKPRFEASCGKRPLSECVDQDAFNNSGYGLLKAKQTDTALVLFELVAWAHPKSANAQDSLADGYQAAGKKAQAIEASKRVLVLVGEDAAIDEGTRAQLVAAAKQRLSSLGGE
ncbi:hypothetical protein [Luteibacter sp. UNCMF366Tsu5.1]|uniref:hypothetical protein n=1 Tax=Luteibacter sp. UNCMF366Tsu5.1 TaxID=1502758 RepID=UPI0009311181|nr:hypothetical protein [Luteibacter sp. UNCMF366Tsu5.1]